MHSNTNHGDIANKSAVKMLTAFAYFLFIRLHGHTHTHTQDRGSIISIHTKRWSPPLKPSFMSQLADHTVGYCGADLKVMRLQEWYLGWEDVSWLEWNLSNQDTNGAEESVIVREVSSFQRSKCMQEWYLGWEKVSCLERCHQFRSVLIERERFHCSSTVSTYCMYNVYCSSHIRYCIFPP